MRKIYVNILNLEENTTELDIGLSKQTTTFPIEFFGKESEDDDYFTRFMRNAFNNICEERDNALKKLESVQQERDSYMKQYSELKDVYVEQSVQLKDCQQKLTALQDHFRKEEEAKQNGIVYPPCDYVPDILDYKEGTDSMAAIYFWNRMYELKDLKKPDGSYLIKGIVDVVPIFLVVSRSDEYDNPNWFFCGTQLAFCQSWNVFVAGRETDEKRKEKLFCKPASFNSALSKIKYDRDPSKWRIKYLQGVSPVDDYRRAVNIKEQVTKRCC